MVTVGAWAPVPILWCVDDRVSPEDLDVLYLRSYYIDGSLEIGDHF